MNPTDITQYIDMALRRKWWIIIPFLLTLLAGLAFALNAPKVYEARTLIVVQSQKVPQDFVRTIVSSDVEDRLRTITQEVTSRTNLERIINELQLFRNSNNGLSSDQKVLSVRDEIKIDISGGGRREETDAFTISFRDKDPEIVMQVTNALASNFITENLKIRESQAIGTATFISDELKSVETRLMAKEMELKQYQEKYMGGLPEQLDTNLRILERLQEQLDQLNSNLRDAESRKIIIQMQISDQERTGAGATIPSTDGDQGPRDLMSLKNELASLESRYTQNHPDVIRLKNMINRLEGERSGPGTDTTEGETAFSGVDQALRRQLQDLSFEMKDLKSEIQEMQSQIKWYQTKVEETPKREQELLSLNRDYANRQELYNSLLERKLEAEIAVSMEKKQKGEQFRIIDPAKIPSHPVEPDVRKVILMTLALGLGLGGGLAFLMETMDTSYRTPEEVKEEIQLPVLVTLPFRHTKKELKVINLKNILAYTATGLVFILSAIGIVVASEGVDKTMEFVRSLIAGA